jgi:hypothetical protein
LLSLKRFKKILLWFFLSLLFLVLALWIFIQTPAGQNWVAQQVTKRLSRDLQTKVSIQHLDFSLFNRMHLEGVLIEDRERDTLLYARDIQVRITDWFFLKDKAVLKFMRMEDAIVKFQRTDSVWRQQFIFDYFASPSTGEKKEAGIQFDLKKVELVNVSFIKKDAWLGEDVHIRVGELLMDAKAVDFSERTFNINTLDLTDPEYSIRNYQKLKPASNIVAVDEDGERIDSSLKWNIDEWVIELDRLNIKNGNFKNDKCTAILISAALMENLPAYVLSATLSTHE